MLLTEYSIFSKFYDYLFFSSSWITAWRVLKLRMEERPAIWRVAVNKFNKQPQTADEGGSSSLGAGRLAYEPSP
jgi:hypothetical protein